MFVAFSTFKYDISLFPIFHCRVPEKEFTKAYKTLPRLKTKVNNFNKQSSSLNSSEDDCAAIRPEWTTVDRVLACRYHLPF